MGTRAGFRGIKSIEGVVLAELGGGGGYGLDRRRTLHHSGRRVGGEREAVLPDGCLAWEETTGHPRDLPHAREHGPVYRGRVEPTRVLPCEEEPRGRLHLGRRQ